MSTGSELSHKHLRATVVVFEIRDFHFLAETLAPEQAARCFSLLAEEVRLVAQEAQGTVLSKLGSACTFFAGPSNALCGVTAALRVLARWKECSARIDGKPLPPVVGAVHTDAFLLIDGSLLAGTGIEVVRQVCDSAPSGAVFVSERTLQGCIAGVGSTTATVSYARDSSEEQNIPDQFLPLSPELEGRVVRFHSAGDPAERPFLLEFRYWAEMKLRRSSPCFPVIRVTAETGVTAMQKTVALQESPRTIHFGKYELIDRIGCGGMGTVWMAHDHLGNKVAIKRLRAPALSAAADVQRLAQEADLMARLCHRNIVRIIETGEASGERFIVMEYILGASLAEVLEHLKRDRGEIGATVLRITKQRAASSSESAANTPHLAIRPPYSDAAGVPIPAAVALITKVCDAVNYAHQFGVLHRDLKPENIMLRPDGEPVVMDFGLAKQVAEGGHQLSLSVSGVLLGTLEYMAPEQAVSSRFATERSDIFSLGGLLFRLLTGVRAFESTGNLAEDVLRLRDFVPSSLRKLNRHIERDLEVIVLKCLAPDPGQRYATAGFLADDLRRYAAGDPIHARPSTLAYRASRSARKNRSALITVGAVLLTLFVLSCGFMVRVVHERNRAESLLTDLRNTAPGLLTQAQHLLYEGKPRAALEKIDQAIRLVPSNAGYRAFRGNILQSSQRLAEAAEEYARALHCDSPPPAASANLALCTAILRDGGGGSSLTLEGQLALADALVAQGRLVEAAPLQEALGRQSPAVEAEIRARLTAYQAQSGWRNSRLRRLPNGSFRLDLSQLTVDDLQILKGLPIAELVLDSTRCSSLQGLEHLPLVKLSLDRTNVVDLTPIRTVPLKWLRASTSGVTDLSPLKGMLLEYVDLAGCHAITDLAPLRGAPLHTLYLTRTDVMDLTPLVGMPLRDLTLASTLVQNLAPLRGLPLENLDLSYIAGRLDLSPLAEARALRTLSLSRSPVNTDRLRNLSSLGRIDWQPRGSFSSSEFWGRFAAGIDSQAPAHVAVVRAGEPNINFGQVEVEPGGMLRLNLRGSAVTDLGPISKLPVRHLDIAGTRVRDLSPLRGTRIEFLDCSGSAVTDLEPLSACSVLQNVVATDGVGNAAAVRRLPQFRSLKLVMPENGDR